MQKILSLILFYCAALLCHGQHQSLNYVRTEQMLDSIGSTSSVSVVTYDGYGRQEYTIVPCGNNCYSAALKMYDISGRESGEWLPAPVSNINSVTNDYDIEEPCRTFYDDDDPCTWIVYDGQDRVVGNYAPGEYLRLNGLRVRHEYLTNVSRSVRRYTCSGSEPLRAGYYFQGNLASERTTDEDGNSVETFRDRLGRTIMERRGGISDTYYIYNNLGLVSHVLSPEYETDDDISLYGYEYEYDSKRRVVSKRLPGCEETRFWYDDGDRMIYMQDAKLREQGLYRFFFYDRLGRPAIQGTCSAFTNRSGHGFVDYDSVNISGSICQTGYVLISTQSISNAQLETCTYYDRYSFLSSSSIPSTVQTALEGLSGAYARGLVTGTITASSNGGYSYGIIYYDERGRKTISREKRSTGTILTEFTSYTFNGSPSVVRSEAQTSGGKKSTSLTEYVYSNHTGQLTDTYLTLDTEERRHVSALSYDAVGRLAGNTRSGNAGCVSYNYNLRGWPIKISSPHFTEWLSYDEGPGTPMYSGAISAIRWQTGNEDFRRGYKFSYDALGRMTSGVYGEGDDLSSNTGRYTENISGYTLNGAITGLTRYGKRDDGSFGLIDDLEVELDGNRVKKVTDSAVNLIYNNSFDFHDESSDDPEYTYDGCGALTSDVNRGITSIEYDNAGMPRLVSFAEGHSTEYVYSATGEKLQVKHNIIVGNQISGSSQVSQPTNNSIGTLSFTSGSTIPSGPIIHDSISIPQFNQLLVEKLEYVGPFILRDGLFYMYLFDGGYCSYPFMPGIVYQPSSAPKEYLYYTKDHLGNNRTVVSENGTLKQVTHYYPFGGVYGDADLNPGTQSYKYNGKEFDHTNGLNWYDYGARMYSPSLPTWTRMDPKCEEYYHISPYTYCANNPVINIDPDGRNVLTKIGKAAIKVGRTVARNGVSSLSKADTYCSAFSDITDNISTLTNSESSGWEKAGAIASLASEFLPVSVGDVKDAGKILNKVKNAVHGNSKLSTKAQHAYDIIDKETNKIVKTGISGGKIREDGKSSRAESQVSKLNKKAGENRYESQITHEEPAGPGARQNILDYEKARADILKKTGHLKDTNIHKKP